MAGRRVAGLLPALAAAGTALAGSLTVAPTRLELGPAQHNAVLTVRNQDESPVVVQVAPMAWSQDGERDQLTDTHDLLVTPPLFTIPPKGQQVVRVALLRKPDAHDELPYRLVLSEVPPVAAPDGGALRIVLRITLPVFVAAAAHAAPQLTWNHHWSSGGTLHLAAHNQGTAHIQISSMDIGSAPPSQLHIHSDQAQYLLPGSSAHWDLQASQGEAATGSLFIQGHSDAGDFTVTSEPGSR